MVSLSTSDSFCKLKRYLKSIDETCNGSVICNEYLFPPTDMGAVDSREKYGTLACAMSLQLLNGEQSPQDCFLKIE